MIEREEGTENANSKEKDNTQCNLNVLMEEKGEEKRNLNCQR